MLTPAEIGSINAALAPALARVQYLEGQAGSSFPLGWLFPDDAQRAAKTARSLYDGAVAARDAAIEDPEPAHEEALRVIQMANDLASPGWVENQQAAATIGTSTVKDWVQKASDWIDQKIPSVSGVTTWVKITIIVVGLVAVAFLVFQVKPWIPRKRHA